MKDHQEWLWRMIEFLRGEEKERKENCKGNLFEIIMVDSFRFT